MIHEEIKVNWAYSQLEATGLGPTTMTGPKATAHFACVKNGPSQTIQKKQGTSMSSRKKMNIITWMCMLISSAGWEDTILCINANRLTHILFFFFFLAYIFLLKFPFVQYKTMDSNNEIQINKNHVLQYCRSYHAGAYNTRIHKAIAYNITFHKNVSVSTFITKRYHQRLQMQWSQ